MAATPRSCLLLLTLLPFVACDEPAEVDGDDGSQAVVDYREAWGASDAPSLLDPDFNYTLSELPGAGAAAQAPWAGSYWPTYRDGINHRWAGATTKSPAKK